MIYYHQMVYSNKEHQEKMKNLMIFGYTFILAENDVWSNYPSLCDFKNGYGGWENEV